MSSKQSARWRVATGAVLVLATLLRAGLALVNREANDDHMEVVAIIADRGVLPQRGDCWECVQPLLYHATCALAIRALGVQDPSARTVLAQGVSAASGVLTLWLFLRFLHRVRPPPAVGLAAFALAALNPRLAAINGQATNDSFVILFGTSALYFLWRRLETGSGRHLAAAVASVCLAGLSKGNGLVVAAVAFAALGLAWPAGREARARRATELAVALAAFALTVPFLGPYVAHYRSHGSLLAVHTPKSPPPLWLRETRVLRPGITSVAHGYLTFRLWGLLEDPFIEVRGPHYPAHRTSLWSQVYGRAHSSRFVQWPPSWRRRDAPATWLGRGLLALGLVPLALTALGALGQGARLARGALRDLAVRRLPRGLRDPDVVFALAAVAFLAFLVRYTYDFRDLAYMKAIFLYPALLACVKYFADGGAWLWERWAAHPRRRVALAACWVSLCALYALDVSLLVSDLARILAA